MCGPSALRIGRAHVCTPVTLIYLVCRPLFFKDPPTPEISPLPLHDPLPICELDAVLVPLLPLQLDVAVEDVGAERLADRKSTRLHSSHTDISRMPSSVF